MKKVLSLVLALSMVLSMFSFSSAASLSDIAGQKYEAAVEALMELGVVNGYPDGTYLPNNVVTRAELAKLLVTAYGLNQAAEVASKDTPFSDVAGNWAAGYINVSADYKFVNGYPDGTFKPDETVTYAEAITMCLRVLGYANEIDSKGTWPTNYIAKAQDLKLMKDVDYKSYNDGATRGNVAILIWNMLRTQMWQVTGESEGDGLISQPNKLMINVKFSDYQYYDADMEFVVTDIDVKDGEVKVTVETDKEFSVRDTQLEVDKINGKAIKLADGAEFLNMFGRTVSVLYNEEENEIAILTPSVDDKVVEDTRYYLDEEGEGDYDFSDPIDHMTWGTASGDDDTHTVAVIGSKKVVDYYTEYTVKAGIVDSVKTKNDKTTIKFSYGTLGTITDAEEDVIFLLDGEWTTADKVKEGDVVTELVPDELYAITRKTVTGSLDAVKDRADKDESEELLVVVDGKDYKFVNVDEVVEIDEDGEDTKTTTLAAIRDAGKDDDAYKFYDEDATLYLNYVGEVIRIEFEEIEDVEKTGHFYVLTNKVPTWEVSDKTGVTTYVELTNETYEIKDADAFSGDLEDLEPGMVVYVKFDSKDRVKELSVVEPGETEDYIYTTSGDGSTNVLDDNNYIGDVKVTSTTTVLTITEVLDEDDKLDHYEVASSKGTEALKGIKDEVIVAVEADDEFGRAAYVFVWDDAESDEQYGIIEEYEKTKGTVSLKIDGTWYEVDENEEFTKDDVGSLILFVTDSEDVLKSHGLRTADDVTSAALGVEKVEGELVRLSGDAVLDLDVLEEEADKNLTVLVIEVSEDAKTADVYTLDTVEEIEVAAMKVRSTDRVVIEPDFDGSNYADLDLIMIVRGMD